MPELRITARGIIPSIGLLLGLASLPYLLAGSLSQQEAEAFVAGIHRQRAAADQGKTQSVRFESLRIRRSLMVPPFARRTSFLIEARRAGTREAEYFRVSSARAYSVGEFWWHIRL